MKILNSVLFLMASIYSVSASAQLITFDCSTPKNLASNSIASIKGKLKLAPMADGKKMAAGKVDFSASNFGKVLFNGPVQVLGAYDTVNGVEYALLGSKDKGMESATFYLNFSAPDRSYIEYLDSKFLIVCKH